MSAREHESPAQRRVRLDKANEAQRLRRARRKQADASAPKARTRAQLKAMQERMAIARAAKASKKGAPKRAAAARMRGERSNLPVPMRVISGEIPIGEIVATRGDAHRALDVLRSDDARHDIDMDILAELTLTIARKLSRSR